MAETAALDALTAGDLEQRFEAFVVSHRERAVPPGLDARSTLPVRARQGRPLDLAGTDADALAPVDQALLETLGTRVVLPVCDAGTLHLIGCLGGKGSGDVYTPTDLRLLEAAANA